MSSGTFGSYILSMFFIDSNDLYYSIDLLVRDPNNYRYNLYKKPPNFSTKNLTDLPSLVFLNFNQILQRRLYQISYPMTRKYFWTVSKLTTNLGPKPTTYVSDDFRFYGESRGMFKRFPRFLQFFNENNLVNVQNYFESETNCDLKFARFFDMNHRRIYKFDRISPGEHANLSLQTLNTFFHRDISEARIDCQFEIIFEMMPNLKVLNYHAKAPIGWEKMISRHETLEYSEIHDTEITDFDTLRKFILNQRGNFVLKVLRRSKIKPDKWFKKVDGKKQFKEPCLVVFYETYLPKSDVELDVQLGV